MHDGEHLRRNYHSLELGNPRVEFLLYIGEPATIRSYQDESSGHSLHEDAIHELSRLVVRDREDRLGNHLPEIL